MFDLKARIKEVLELGHLMSLGTVDEQGVWVADLVYVFDEDFTIYWMSDSIVRHSAAILSNPKVAGNITISTKSKEFNLGLQFSGHAYKIEGPRFDLAKKHLAKRGYPEPTEVEDILKGYSWYGFVPAFIELIDEEHFGFEKQKFVPTT